MRTAPWWRSVQGGVQAERWKVDFAGYAQAIFEPANSYSTFFHPKLPEVLRGSTVLSLSQNGFQELKTKGETRHRYIQLKLRQQPEEHWVVEDDQDGILRREDPGPSSPYRIDLSNTLDLQVNGRLRSLPIINVRGVIPAEHGNEGQYKVLDDAAFPLVLEYEHVGWKFKIAYTSISYPGDLEQQLSSPRGVRRHTAFISISTVTSCALNPKQRSRRSPRH